VRDSVRHLDKLVPLVCLLFAPWCGAQVGGKQPAAGGGNGGAPGGSGSPLQGLSYSLSQSLQQLGAWPFKQTPEHVRVLCFSAVYSTAGSLPVVLEASTTQHISDALGNVAVARQRTGSGQPNGASGTSGNNKAKLRADTLACSSVDDDSPLTAGELLVIAIDVSAINVTLLKVLNLNLATQQGVSLTPAPVRQGGVGLGAGGENKTNPPKVLFLLWPSRLQPDVIPTLTVNALYTRPAPGSAWQHQIHFTLQVALLPRGKETATTS